jgi:hypothetical protein
MLDRKRLAFGAVFGAILVAVTLTGIEFWLFYRRPGRREPWIPESLRRRGC